MWSRRGNACSFCSWLAVRWANVRTLGCGSRRMVWGGDNVDWKDVCQDIRGRVAINRTFPAECLRFYVVPVAMSQANSAVTRVLPIFTNVPPIFDEGSASICGPDEYRSDSRAGNPRGNRKRMLASTKSSGLRNKFQIFAFSRVTLDRICPG